MKKILFVLLCMIPYVTWADDTTPKKTPCATAAFIQGLSNNASNISAISTEAEIEQFVMNVFSDKTTLENVLKCSEIKKIADNAVITFDTITYEFPSKQTVTINYETQPRVLNQRLLLAQKQGLPSNNQSALLSDDVSPNGEIWTYTDPAWYGIMVTQHGALATLIDEQTNTISLATIEANIEKDGFYPQGGNCTSRSAIANDGDAINRAVTKTAGIDNPATKTNEDSNDYYVAGDINLAWIGYAEMVLDVVITVGTLGGGLIITGGAKGASAARALKGMTKTYNTLKKGDHVQNHIKNLSKISKLVEEKNRLDPVTDALQYATKTKEIEALEALTNPKNIDKNITRVKKELKTVRRTNNSKEIASKEKELKNLEDLLEYDNITKTFSDVNQYRREITGITRLKNLPKQRGNIIARGVKTGSRATKTIWKSVKATRGGADKLNKAKKMGRASKLSTRISDRLFHFTMKNAASLGKMQTLAGTFYASLIAAGKFMYNITETSTGDFTNNIPFRPFLLLSADDLPEGDQADKINYGMWLMWMGDSYRPADDDAAYLQAMDFAAKFYEDLMEVQDPKIITISAAPNAQINSETTVTATLNDGAICTYKVKISDNNATTSTVTDDQCGNLEQTNIRNGEQTTIRLPNIVQSVQSANSNVATVTKNSIPAPCNVDIYVVKPIIKNPGKSNPELHYLIMNEVPWTTAQ